LASGDDRGEIRLWDTASRKLLHTLSHQGDEKWIFGLCFHPLGEVLASGSYDKTVKLWHAGTGRLLRTLEGHTDRITSVSFSSDGRLIASLGESGDVRVWDPDSSACLVTIPRGTSGLNWHASLAFHPRLPLLAAVSRSVDAPDDTVKGTINI